MKYDDLKWEISILKWINKFELTTGEGLLSKTETFRITICVLRYKVLTFIAV